jgi:hypothetical protein
MRKLRFWHGVLIAAAGLASVIVLPTIRVSLMPACPEQRRTDVLLNGGLPACMGRLISDVLALGGSPDESSWDVYYEDYGREYWYNATGGLDLLMTQIGMRLTRACVNKLGSGTADVVGARAAARLAGGVVPYDSIIDNRPRRVWTLPGGGQVLSDRNDFVCVTVPL